MSTASPQGTLICISPDSAHFLCFSFVAYNQPCSHSDFNIFQFNVRDFLIYESRIPASGLDVALNARLIEWKRWKTKTKQTVIISLI